MQADIKSMGIYGGTLALTLLLSFLHNRQTLNRKWKELLWVAVIALPLSILGGLRSGIGTDYFNYCEIFQLISFRSLSGLTNVRLEYGFVLLVKGVQLITSSYAVCFFVIQFITLFAAFYCFSKLRSKMDMTIAVLLYYLICYHQSLNVIRQSLAVSFVMLALVYFTEKKYIFYAACNLLAVLFHYSAIVTLVFGPVIFLFGRERKALSPETSLQVQKRRLFIYLGLMVFLSLLMPFAVRIAGKFSVFSWYADYLKNIQPGIGTAALYVLMVGPALVFKTNTLCTHKELSQLKYVILMYLPLSILGYGSTWGSRITMYTVNLMPLFVPLLIREPKDAPRFSVSNWVGLYYIAYYTASFVYDILILNYNETFPYRTIWG